MKCFNLSIFQVLKKMSATDSTIISTITTPCVNNSVSLDNLYFPLKFVCLVNSLVLFLFFQIRIETGPEYECNRTILETRHTRRRTEVRHNRLRRTHKNIFHLPWFSYSSCAFGTEYRVYKKKWKNVLTIMR